MLVKTTARFRKALKRSLRSGRFDRQKLERVVNVLASGKKLEESYQDHELSAELVGHRECHLGFDLLLIYRIENNNLVLVLVGLGSHDDLFG